MKQQCNCKRCMQKRNEEDKKDYGYKQNQKEENFRPFVCEKYTKEVIYEEPVYCITEENFHHHVKHVVPVIYKKVENHHLHHEYVVDKKFKEEYKETNHGKFDGDFCELGKRCGNKNDKDREDKGREDKGREDKGCNCGC